MISLTLNELKLFSKSRDVKNYRNKSEDELIKILSESKPKRNFSKLRIEKIRKKIHRLSDRFSKSKVKETTKNLYENKN